MATTTLTGNYNGDNKSNGLVYTYQYKFTKNVNAKGEVTVNVNKQEIKYKNEAEFTANWKNCF